MAGSSGTGRRNSWVVPILVFIGTEVFESLKKPEDHATEEIFNWTAKWNRWLRFLLPHGCGFSVSKGGGRQITVRWSSNDSGRRRSRAILLRLYSFLAIVAATLSIIVLAGGDLTLEDMKNIDIYGTKKLEFLEAARVLLGLLVQILAIKTTFSLIHNMSPPKRAS